MIRTVSLLALIVAAATSFAAESIDAEAEYKLGRSAWTEGDIVGAMKPLKVAADAGHAAAQALYADLLDQADNDVEAMAYYEKSANQGNPDGLLGYAGMLISGDGGKKDLKAAHKLMEKAAEQGHRPSIIALAIGLASDTFGFGAESRDSADTWKWVRKAAEVNDLMSMRLLESAYRQGNAHVKQDLVAAEALRVKGLTMQGIDPNAKPKRQRR